MAYQSFGNIKGDSDSIGKLKAINLPDLRGKKFLDVGCNTGFFCGAALESGATHVVGLDVNQKFIELARQYFPAATFYENGWEQLPSEKFDVVILLSALHYAEDQANLIHNLMSKVEKNGLLVLEIGIVSGEEEKWVEIKRAIDTRLFPTMPMVRRVLDRYAYRLIGESVAQAGDPIPRYVFHVWHRKPAVIACLGEGGIGKSNMARLIRGQSHESVEVLQLDDYLPEFASLHGIAPGDSKVGQCQDEGFKDLSKLYAEISRKGLLSEFADMVCSKLAATPLSLIDGAIPDGYRTHFLNQIGRRLDIDIWALTPVRVRPAPHGEALAITNTDWASFDPANGENPQIHGYVDEIRLTDVGLIISGWGYDKLNGGPIDGLRIVHDGKSIDVMQINRRRRAGVMELVKSDMDLLGYAAELPLDKEFIAKLRNDPKSRLFNIFYLAGCFLSPAINSKSVIV